MAPVEPDVKPLTDAEESPVGGAFKEVRGVRYIEQGERPLRAALLGSQQITSAPPSQALAISAAQYKAGTTSYLQVITSQTAALQAERSAVDILTRRMVANVLPLRKTNCRPYSKKCVPDSGCRSRPMTAR